MNRKYQKNSSSINFEDCKGLRCVCVCIYMHIHILEHDLIDLIDLEIYKNI